MELLLTNIGIIINTNKSPNGTLLSPSSTHSSNNYILTADLSKYFIIFIFIPNMYIFIPKN